MIITIHQPNYLPWLGFFHKMYNCDFFVFLDNVLYSKETVINRNKIKTPDGWSWLTVPVKSHGILEKKICDVDIHNGTDWGSKHFKTLYYHYKNAVFFKRYALFFEKLYEKKWEKLAELNEEIIYYLAKQFKIDKRLIRASELDVHGSREELIINICKVLGGDTYYSGVGAKAYQVEKRFIKAGINLMYQNFKHPIYKQQFGDFIPNLSAIDLLFNYGPRSIEILLGKSDYGFNYV